MIAIILCAGYATRMYPLTANFPKPLLPVAGKPVIDYLIGQLTTLPSLQSLHLVTNAKFFSHFQNEQSRWEDWLQIPIVLYNDGSTDNANRLGATADLQLVLNQVNPSTPLLVSAGDNIFRFRLAPIVNQFLTQSHHMIVALPEIDRYKLHKTGVLELGPDNRVLELHEKPVNPPSEWSCPALYFLQPTALKCLDTFLQTSAHFDAPGHFLAYLCQRESVMAVTLNSQRLDIGNIESYHHADHLLQQEPVFI